MRTRTAQLDGNPGCLTQPATFGFSIEEAMGFAVTALALLPDIKRRVFAVAPRFAPSVLGEL
jgi:hypothetical protein